LSLSSVAYILVIPLSWRRFVLKKCSGEQDSNFSVLNADVPVQTSDDEAHTLKVVGFRSPEIKQ
ncbi:MAG: hypothetical protein ACKOW3_08130, partial [Hyphomicrobium sp.]